MPLAERSLTLDTHPPSTPPTHFPFKPPGCPGAAAPPLPGPPGCPRGLQLPLHDGAAQAAPGRGHRGRQGEGQDRGAALTDGAGGRDCGGGQDGVHLTRRAGGQCGAHADRGGLGGGAWVGGWVGGLVWVQVKEGVGLTRGVLVYYSLAHHFMLISTH